MEETKETTETQRQMIPDFVVVSLVSLLSPLSSLLTPPHS